MWKAGLLAATLLVLPNGQRGHAEQPLTPASRESSEGWERIVPKPLTINGRRYKPTCSGAPGTSSSTDSFFYRQGTADGLLVFFNGGGACWNSATCSKPRLAGDKAFFSGKDGQNMVGVYKAELLPGDGPARMGGLLDRANPRNPVRDWSMLFVPYCTGDVHSGSNTARYTEPNRGQPFTIEHRGWDNLQVILPWLRARAPRPARLLVSGSSAGACGAATHYTALRTLYPNARAVYLGDSGLGVTTPDFERVRNKNWNDTLPAFYAQMGPAGQACNAWTNKMLRELASRQAAPNVRAYVAQGDTHTILRAPLFDTEASGGVAFADWLRALLEDSQPPANARCPTCEGPRVGCAP